MSVYDQWHKSRPRPGEAKCGCKPPKVPTAQHGQGERWQVRYRDDAGIQRKRNFDRRPDADRFDTEIKNSLNRGEYIDPSAGKVTLGAYARIWRAGLSADPRTLEQIDSHLSKWVYGKPINDQTMGALAKRPSLIQAWIKDMESSLMASSIKGVVDTLGAIFEAAVDDQVVGRNPVKAQSVKPPTPARKKVVPWTLGQVAAMAAALGELYGPMVFLGAGCGHRQGELFGVAVEDIDFLGRLVHVNRQVRLIAGRLVFSPPKRGKTRTVPLPESLGLWLSAYIARHPPVAVTLPWVEKGKPRGDLVTAELLFPGPNGGALHRNTFNHTWHVGLERAGIVPPPAKGERRKSHREHGCHVLRHTAASAWLGAGVDIRTVAEYLGHSDPGFTLRTYTHLMPNAADRARKAMDAFFTQEQTGPSALVVPSGRSI